MVFRRSGLVPGMGTIVLLAALLTAAVGWAQESQGPAQSSYMAGYIGAGAEKIGSERCVMCHPGLKPDSPFTHLALFDLNPDSPSYGFGCEACHGPGGNHNGNVAGIIQPAKMSQDEITGLCSKCHSTLRTYDVQGWHLSGHNSAGLSCLSCHSGHTGNAKFLVNEGQLELCFTCHPGKRAEFNMRSHHPVEEGQLSCDDCHNPMSGVFPGQLKAEDDELCFNCHGDKQGPFVYDHDMSAAAGGNGCLTCHFIHGSNADNLLRFPHRLCLQCHSDRDAEQHYPGTCWSTGCHTQIHGSYTSPLFFD